MKVALYARYSPTRTIPFTDMLPNIDPPTPISFW